MNGNFKVLAKLFSADTFRSLCQPDSTEIRTLVEAAGVSGLRRRMRLRTLFDKAYEHLLASYRCEYVYKNAITNELLLQRHAPASESDQARLLTEFWVGDARADVAVVNGTSTAYEVKTSLDTLARMPRQIEAYSRFFDRIYIVTSEKMRRSIEAMVADHVGVLVLNDRAELEESRAAHSNKANVDLHMLFRSMRELEVLQICRSISGMPLNMPNGLRSEACWKLFRQMSTVDAHDAMVSVIRTRKIHDAQKELVRIAPLSLKHLCLGKTLGVSQYRAILQQL